MNGMANFGDEMVYPGSSIFPGFSVPSLNP